MCDVCVWAVKGQLKRSSDLDCDHGLYSKLVFKLIQPTHGWSADWIIVQKQDLFWKNNDDFRLPNFEDDFSLEIVVLQKIY